MTAWSPLLHGDDAARARAAIDAVARALKAPDPAWGVGPSLANGDAGLAVFYSYLAKAEPDRGWEDVAARCLERAIDTMAAVTMVPSLHHGYLGVAWATQHLVEPGDDDLNEAIDDALQDVLRPPSDGDYDLLTGLVGFGMYALERWPHASARGLLERVVAQLGAIAERTSDGTRWRSPPHTLDPIMVAQFPAGVFNVGLAHGAPGVIVLLSGCIAAGVAVAPARELLDGAVQWLLAQALPDGSGGQFPDLVSPGAAASPARLAWCYGDLSVATALSIAGHHVGEPHWQRHGLELARFAATRSDETTGVLDACVCHGTAGLGLMFARVAHVTGDPVLEAAARRWFVATLDRREIDSVVGGFAPFMIQSGIALGDTSVGLLTGAAGVALALLAAITSDAPAWDRSLLLSLPTVTSL